MLHYIPSLIHDLRNPLQQMYASIELYRNSLNSMSNPLFDILSSSVSLMNDLISKALTTFQKIIECNGSETITKVHFEKIDISKYLEDFWNNNLPIAESKTNVDY